MTMTAEGVERMFEAIDNARWAREEREERRAKARPPSLIECRFHVVCPVCSETLEWRFTKLAEAFAYARRVAHEHTHTPHLLVYDLMGPKRRRACPDMIPTAQEAAPLGGSRIEQEAASCGQ